MGKHLVVKVSGEHLPCRYFQVDRFFLRLSLRSPMRLFIALPRIFAIVTICGQTGNSDAMGSSLGMNALTLPYPIQYESTVATLAAHFFLRAMPKGVKIFGQSKADDACSLHKWPRLAATFVSRAILPTALSRSYCKPPSVETMVSILRAIFAERARGLGSIGREKRNGVWSYLRPVGLRT